MKTWAELTAALGPEDAATVQRFLGSTSLNLLATRAAAADQDPLEWARAAATLQRWIEARGLEASTEHKLGYLSCAAEGAKIVPVAMRPNFCRTVEDFLTTYGFSKS